MIDTKIVEYEPKDVTFKIKISREGILQASKRLMLNAEIDDVDTLIENTYMIMDALREYRDTLIKYNDLPHTYTKSKDGMTCFVCSKLYQGDICI